jgi:hypothetical protein
MTDLAPALAPIALEPQQLLVQCVSDGIRIGLQMAYVEGAGKSLNKAGAAWCAPRRCWVVEHGTSKQTAVWLKGLFHGQFFDFDSIEPMLNACLSKPEPDYFTQILDLQVFPLRGGGYAVSSIYDLAVVKAMRSLGGRFHRYASAWEVRRPVPAILAALKTIAGVAEDYIFVHEHEVVLETMVSPAASSSPIKVDAAPPPRGDGAGSAEDVGTGFLSALTEVNSRIPVDEVMLTQAALQAGLRDYQVVGVRHILGQMGSLLGDDMGLGKSRQTVVATRLAAGDGRVLILCPASLRINWEREIRMVYPNAVIGMVGEDRLATLYGCQWVIANYERTGGLVRECALNFAVMAVDEAHYLKEHDSGRTRNVFVLSSRIPRRYAVTGTPLLNREIELHTLLRLTGHRLGQLPLADFRKQYTGHKDRRAALAEALKGWMLRRRKDVLTELGTKSRQLRYLSPPEGIESYNEIVRDMSLMVMPKIVKMRQALEALKTTFLIETIESLADDDKVIVFCEYMATVDVLRSAFAAANISCVTLVGSDNGKKRQKAIDAFQNDPQVRVFIGTTSAAGVGITLTAANYVIFASLPWTPALMRQAEDRAYRLGQKRDVFVIVPLIPKTVDEQVWQLLANKTELEQDVVEAVRAQLPTH